MNWKCIFADDADGVRRLYPTHILKEWGALYPDVPLCAKGYDFEEAKQLLENHPGEHQLVVIDILDKRESPPGKPGLDLINQAGEQSGVAIIAVSEEDAELDEPARSGVVTVAKRSAFQQQNKESLRQAIANAMERAGLEPVAIDGIDLTLDEQSLQLRAAMNRVTEEVVKALVRKVRGAELQAIDVGFIRSGLSGATVFRCIAKGQNVGGPYSEEMLLKLSRDLTSIESEAERMGREGRAFADWMFPTAITEKPVSHGGWHAIATRFRGGETLSDWLEEDPSPDEVAGALSRLFLNDGLARTYLSSNVPARHREELAPEVVLHDTLGEARAARVQLGARDLWPLADSHGVPPEDLPRVVEAFLTSGRVGERDVETVRKGTLKVRAHGDLHGRNIIVRESQPVLIDPANIERYHWPADWARLCIDLFLRGLSTRADAHDWEGLPDWIAAGDEVLGLEEPELEVLPPSFRSAVTWLLDAREEIFGPLFEGEPLPVGEVRLALAAEALRGAYRVEELSTPTRVAALVIGTKGLLLAESDLPESTDGKARATAAD